MTKSDKTGIGDRMKSQYEMRAQTHLPRRTYTIIRLDGKAFHTYTKGCVKPWDRNLANAMVNACGALCEEAQGVRLGYVQSDEISVVLSDFATIQTDAWFDGNVQKIVSVAASCVTAAFNRARHGDPALFDARAFTIPDRTEVINYLIWRQQDCIRNSIIALAQAHFSHQELHGKNGKEMLEMLRSEKDVDWSTWDERFKNGYIVYRETYEVNTAIRHRWTATAAPIFSESRDALDGWIPSYE